MITSKDNQQLKTIRRLQRKRHDGLFVAEGEDLVDAAALHGWAPELLLRAGVDVDAELLASASALGSGSRVIGVYRERWSEPSATARVSIYLHGVHDPGNVGTIVRAAHALADGPVLLGPDCADPFSPKAVRASMGSLFARPPARAAFEDLAGTKVALERGAGVPLRELALEPPLVLCLGAERDGLPAELVQQADAVAHIPLRADGPDSLNVAMAAAIAVYELTRMPSDA